MMQAGEHNDPKTKTIQYNAPRLCFYLRILSQTADSLVEQLYHPSVHDVAIFVGPCKEKLIMEWKEDIP